MDEPVVPEGMGPAPTGPSFAPYQQSVETESRTPTPRPQVLGEKLRIPTAPTSLAPSTSRLPALVTAAAVLLVAAVVLGATWVAERNDARVSAPTVSLAPARTVLPPRDDSIEISSSEGSGRLVILDHHWASPAREAPQTPSTLDVEVKLVCTSGELNFDPYFFQAFDQSGALFEVLAPDSANSLRVGTLGPDDQVVGTVSFDLPRGQVTLLMTDESTHSVTALKIPD